MSADKRRRARVQGGWAAPLPKSRSRATAVRLPANTIGVGAACLGKTVDMPNPQAFVFQEPEEVR